MRLAAPLCFSFTAVAVAVAAFAFERKVEDGAASAGAGPYSADAAHPWNRLHRALFSRRDLDGREHGLDALDPLLWPNSRWIFAEPRYGELLAALDALRAEELAGEQAAPLLRALLQRDLWAVFDWLANDAPAEERERALDMKRRIAAAIAHVALDESELARLPDNYALAAASSARAGAGEEEGLALSLPADLFDPGGPWIELADRRDGWSVPLATAHARHLRGRSSLAVLLRLPGGREATGEYLARLAAEDPTAACSSETCGLPGDAGAAHRHLRADLPALPAGSAVALVRRALLVGRDGRPRATPLVEMLQLRHFTGAPDPAPELRFDPAPWSASQRVAEFRLDRAALLAGERGGLLPLHPDRREHPLFGSHGVDPFEAAGVRESGLRPLQNCVQCHAQPGILSLPSFTRIASGPGTLPSHPLDRLPALLVEARAGQTSLVAERFKAARHDFGLLRGLSLR